MKPIIIGLRYRSLVPHNYGPPKPTHSHYIFVDLAANKLRCRRANGTDCPLSVCGIGEDKAMITEIRLLRCQSVSDMLAILNNETPSGLTYEMI